MRKKDLSGVLGPRDKIEIFCYLEDGVAGPAREREGIKKRGHGSAPLISLAIKLYIAD